MSVATQSPGSENPVLEKPATSSRPAPKGATQESAMIASSSNAHPEGKLASIDLSQIDANPFQHRQTMDEQKMEELVGAIQSQGLLQRPLVRAAGDRYQLAFGHRRKEAFTRLLERSKDRQWARLPVVVRELSDSDMQLFNLAENLSVEDPPVVEIAAGIAQYQRTNSLSLTALAEKLGQKEVRLKRLLRLHQAPTVIKNACSDGLVVEDGEDGKGPKSRRRLDLMACLELMKLYKHYQTTDAFGAEGRIGAVVEKALKDGWSFRKLETYIANALEAVPTAETPIEVVAASAPLFKATEKQLTVFRERMPSATPAEKKELKKLLDEIQRLVA